MDLHAHAVAEAVGEIVSIPCVLDDPAGNAVHFRAGHAGLGGGDGGFLGGEDGLVDPALLGGNFAHGNGAGHVRAVAAVDAAKVHGHQLAALDDLLAGHAVREAAVDTGDHDGVKAHVGSAVVEHQILEPCGDLLFRDAGADLLQNVVKGPLGDTLGGHHGGHFLFVLHHAQLRQKVRGGDQGAAELLLIKIVVLDGHIGVLKAHGFKVLGLDDLVDEGGIAPAPGNLGNGGVLDVALRRLGVAGVGEVVVAPAGHQANAVGAGRMEAAGVEAVGLVCQEHGVQAPGGEGVGNFRKMIHRPSSTYLRSCASPRRAASHWSIMAWRSSLRLPLRTR